MTAIKDFSEWLREELEVREWKPTDLARRAELDDGIISRALSGARMPSTQSLEKMANAFDMPVDLIFRIAGLLPPVTEQEEWAARMYRRLERLPPDLRDIAETLITALYEKENAMKKQSSRKK